MPPDHAGKCRTVGSEVVVREEIDRIAHGVRRHDHRVVIALERRVLRKCEHYMDIEFTDIVPAID